MFTDSQLYKLWYYECTFIPAALLMLIIKWFISVFMSFDPPIIIIISCFHFIVLKNIESRVRLYEIGLNQFVYGAKFFE